MNHKPLLTHAGFLLLVVGGGLLIGFFNIPGEWYESLRKPPFNPPNWIFGPVWTLLYVLVAIAGARTWLRARRSPAMTAWWAQLVLNFLWSPTFFSLHAVGVALVIVLALVAAVVAFVALAWREDRLAALFFLPYLAWVSFASVLNASILWLN